MESAQPPHGAAAPAPPLTMTLREALQRLPLAYSPLTRQLHRVDAPRRPSDAASTASSGGDPAGGLLDAGRRSPPGPEGDPPGRGVLAGWRERWFGGRARGGSPIRGVASSSALIQLSRPAHLPAKAAAEEVRHREEHAAIIAAARKREAQMSISRLKQHKLQLQLDEQQSVAIKHFNCVLRDWESMSKTRKTRDFWWQGLPSSVRGKVWRLAIGNELNLTRHLHEICAQRAHARLRAPPDRRPEAEDGMDAIQLDIARTFPQLCIFQDGGPYSAVLHSLLAAYVCYRPDVGYVQGMSYIAAILILNMEQWEAFICFANLLNRPLHLSAFSLNHEEIEAYYQAYNEVFDYNLPKLYRHFQLATLAPELYLLEWIYTVFAKAMPLDVACRVWDVFLRDGDEFIFRTALGILHLNQDLLIEMDFLQGAQFLIRLPDDLSPDQLFKSIQIMVMNVGKLSFHQIVEKYMSIVR